MSGIFAAINQKSVTNDLIKGLEALSYRGYDSAGIAVVKGGRILRRRAPGKLKNLIDSLEKSPIKGEIGIAHTRWATRSEPSQRNSQPHMTPLVAVVHNGIVENTQILRVKLLQEGYRFGSDTDSEIFPLLISYYLNKRMGHKHSIQCALNDIEGNYAIAAVFHNAPNTLFAARSGSPLVIGSSNEGVFLSSDENALYGKADNFFHMKDGDFAQISLKNIHLSNGDTQWPKRKLETMIKSMHSLDRDSYEHFMLKEIHQQPGIINLTSFEFIDANINKVEFKNFPFDLRKIDRLSIIACGTSYYAGMIAQYWLESMAKIPVSVDMASEYRYRHRPFRAEESALFISQSGETADTLAALQLTKNQHTPCFSILNVRRSRMAKESDYVMYTQAGTEIGVVATKAFTAQLTTLLGLTLAIASANKTLKATEEQQILNELSKLPAHINKFIHRHTATIKNIAEALYSADKILYLGRGIAYPLALEGALKLKETSYINAHAYPAGELKHGPITLVEQGTPAIVIAPPGELFSKTLHNLREISNRGARVTLISDQNGINFANNYITDAIVMPDINEALQPLIYTIPLQLLAYYIAAKKGCDIDQPRNLAKSVTVE